jgi:hypothetical protein
VSCNQCGKPAVVTVQGNPLCVDRFGKLQEAIRIRDTMLEKQINFLIGQAEAVTGLYGITPRYEMTPVVHQGAMMFHNINVDRSAIGAVNTGSVQRIDVALSHIKTGGSTELEKALKDFTEAVVTATSLSVDAKNEILEQVAEIAAHATVPKEARRRGVLKALVSGVSSAVSTVTNLSKLWSAVRGLLD